MSTIERFYTAFAERDWSTMGACYCNYASFNDPVFRNRNATVARAS